MDYIKLFLDFISDNISEWPLGTIMVILIIIVLIVIIGLICWGLFIAIDSWFHPKIQGKGKVIDKTFTPAYTQLIPTYNAATKTTMLQPIYHPDDWAITVAVEGMQDSISINKEFYDNLSIGTIVDVEYVYGRISKNLHIKVVYS